VRSSKSNGKSFLTILAGVIVLGGCLRGLPASAASQPGLCFCCRATVLDSKAFLGIGAGAGSGLSAP
jgi:hypothetical protein